VEARLLRLSICFRNVYQHEIPGKRRQVEGGQNNWGISQLRLQRAAYFQPTKVYTTHMCSNLLETDMDTYGHGWVPQLCGCFFPPLISGLALPAGKLPGET